MSYGGNYGLRPTTTLDRLSSGYTCQFREEEALGILGILDKDELERLHNNDTKLQDLINDLQQVKNLQVDREMLLASNKSLADYNLSQQPMLQNGRTALATAYEEAKRLQDAFNQDKTKLDDLSQNMSPDTMHALLQTEAAKTEEKTEKYAEKFVEGAVDVDEFLETFISERTQAHLRRIKAEKMGELLQTRNGAYY